MSATFPRPPFDPELEAVLTVLADQFPPTLTADMIPDLRRSSPAEVSDEMLEGRRPDPARRRDPGVAG
ncbi:hypothetical protein ACUJ8N_20245 [Streptomyces sp. ESR1.13]|uniref:hypothetical protein n=1 Tax=unclassified Streptomyces TaxID=2593676 RepID=UPI000AFDA137